MSEDNKATSQLNKRRSSNSSRRHKKRYVVLPYIIIPIVFVLLSLIVIAPVSKALMNKAVDTVHKSQETLTIDYNDLKAEDSNFKASEETSGAVSLPKLVSSEKIGVITCENAGLNTSVYYGLNRVSLRSGAAVSAKSSLFGEGKGVHVYGYSSTAFKSLYHLEVDDEITVSSRWGRYIYKVVSCENLTSAPKTDENVLILSTSKDNKAFSDFDDEKYYVVAEFVSGPTVKGVQ